MSVLAEKSLDRPVMNKYETLFHRHPSNPILTGKDWPYSMNSVLMLALRCCRRLHSSPCRVEDRRGLSHLCVARSANGVDGWQIDREPTFIPDVERFPRSYGASKIRASRICRNSSNMPWLTLRIRVAVPECLWHSRKISRIRETRCRHVAGRQRRALLPRRINGFGLDPSAHDAAWSAHLDFVLSPICGIGAITSSCWKPAGGLGGCQQNWNVTARD